MEYDVTLKYVVFQTKNLVIQMKNLVEIQDFR